nr:uncharacterized protein LOC106028077 [Cavia porcellus]
MPPPLSSPPPHPHTATGGRDPGLLPPLYGPSWDPGGWENRACLGRRAKARNRGCNQRSPRQAGPTPEKHWGTWRSARPGSCPGPPRRQVSPLVRAWPFIGKDLLGVFGGSLDSPGPGPGRSSGSARIRPPSLSRKKAQTLEAARAGARSPRPAAVRGSLQAPPRTGSGSLSPGSGDPGGEEMRARCSDFHLVRGPGKASVQSETKSPIFLSIPFSITPENLLYYSLNPKAQPQ